MAKKKTEPKESLTTYFVRRRGGNDQKVTVPSSWKVTFGPLNPGSRNPEGGHPALRFYEAENKQRMVITDVMEFRDMAIAVEEKRVSVKKQTFYKDTPSGQKAVVMGAELEEWVNPDAPDQGSADEYHRLKAPEPYAEGPQQPVETDDENRAYMPSLNRL